MRHNRKTNKLSRATDQRVALLRSLATHLIIHQRIKTTFARAKEASKLVDKLITLGKAGTLFAQRQAHSLLGNRAITTTLFKDIAPNFKDRFGGYTRVIRLVLRAGDGDKMAILELTAIKIKAKPESKKEKKSKVEKPQAAKEAVKEEKPKQDALKDKQEPIKEKPKADVVDEKRDVKAQEKPKKSGFFSKMFGKKDKK